MKHALALFMAAALICSLAACGALSPGSAAVSSGAPEPTEAEVLSAYRQAAKLYDWFDPGTMPLRASDAKNVDGRTYQRTDDPDIGTMEALRSALSGLFAPELVQRLLDDGGTSPHYRDIGGGLYALDAARGSNLHLLGKTVSAKRVDAGHWTVTLTFYADSYDADPSAAVIGWSQTALDYKKTADGWRFTDFCPGDALDESADTVFTFNYTAEALPDGYTDWSDLQLACWQLHADGAYAEGPGDTLTNRFLSDPDGWFDALSVFADSPWKNAASVMAAPAYAAYAWFTEEELRHFEDILTSYRPKSNSEQTLLDTLKTAADRARQLAAENETAAFAFLPGGEAIVLGARSGAYPWGCADFPETPAAVGTGDHGEQCYTFSCRGVTVDYFVNPEDGSSYVNRMSAVSPEPKLPRGDGLGPGSTRAQLLSAYPEAVEYGALQPAQGTDFDTCYVYEPGGLAYCKHIAFFLKDGVIAEIDLEDLMDGRLLER